MLSGHGIVLINSVTLSWPDFVQILKCSPEGEDVKATVEAIKIIFIFYVDFY